ncbi:[citrate (pro-3S)-lyase] ligase [Lactobacillus crispatus]|uniref:[citrate (pro-3S)-lyase] ligase n=1 Tax=Lactobacillus crispatus TaxID=47770 RepID=UPI0015DFC3D9|nr:[citrate (pro-3S)-lyase] ligase [Lactobacillus crispatus]QLK31934.1 [citrate (pro-3S)-lyase] ligase [Lactobacillus crispatus]
MDKVVDLFLNDATTRQKWENLLESLGLNDFSEREVNVIDHTIGLEDEEGNLVGTGSVAGNVLKYIGVKNDADTQGARFNKVVTALTQYLTNDGIFHSFVFTKAKYATSFEHLHFNLLAKTDQAAFLENGMPDVKEFVAEVPEIADQEHKKVAAIVMNANPFTLGHQHLIKMASEENDLVYVFVVANDVSLFSFDERFKLVQEGTKEFSNVKVISGGDYMVSPATFPAYFLKSPDDLIAVQTVIDAAVFKNQIAPGLNITRRYIGKEPISRTTHFYNVSLAHELGPEIEVIVIDRLEKDGQIVTATKVRQLIKDGNLKEINKFVPETTYEFIKQNMQKLQSKIEKGMNIDGI